MRRMEIDCLSKGDRIMVRVEYLFMIDYISGEVISESMFPVPHGSYIILVDADCRHKVNNLKYKRCPVEDIACVLKKKEEKKVEKIERKILETFEHDGVKLMCVQSKDEYACKLCYYKKDEQSKCTCDRDIAGACVPQYRSDQKDVIFIQVSALLKNKPNTNYYLVEICSTIPNESYRVNKIVISEKPLTREEIIKEVNLPSDYITKIEILEDAHGE